MSIDESHDPQATTLLPIPSQRVQGGKTPCYRSLYGLRVDFEQGTIQRMIIVHNIVPGEKEKVVARKKFRFSAVDTSE